LAGPTLLEAEAQRQPSTDSTRDAAAAPAPLAPTRANAWAPRQNAWCSRTAQQATLAERLRAERTAPSSVASTPRKRAPLQPASTHTAASRAPSIPGGSPRSEAARFEAPRSETPAAPEADAPQAREEPPLEFPPIPPIAAPVAALRAAATPPASLHSPSVPGSPAPPRPLAALSDATVHAAVLELCESVGPSDALPERRREGAAHFTPRGLVNTGNLCFINSVLQALLGSADFCALLAVLERAAPALALDELPTLCGLAALAARFEAYKSASDAEDEAEAPRDVWKDGKVASAWQVREKGR